MKPKVIIATDIGGSDQDDTQSFIHSLFYTDRFDLLGVVTGCKNGKVSAAVEVVSEYRRDFPRLSAGISGLLDPELMLQRIKQGQQTPQPEKGYSTTTPGSRWIMRWARECTPDNPLYVLGWGSLTNVAQALHDDGSIAAKMFVYASCGWNLDQDPNAYYFCKSFKKLRLITSVTTHRGMFVGTPGDGRYENHGFVEKVIKPAGHLGRYFYEHSHVSTGDHTIKMGDTASLLWLIDPRVGQGRAPSPTEDSWGGRFIQESPNKWTDSRENSLKVGDYYGAKTVAMHQREVREDWEKRLALITGLDK